MPLELYARLRVSRDHDEIMSAVCHVTGVSEEIFSAYNGFKTPLQAGQEFQPVCARVKFYTAQLAKTTAPSGR